MLLFYKSLPKQRIGQDSIPAAMCRSSNRLRTAQSRRSGTKRDTADAMFYGFLNTLLYNFIKSWWKAALCRTSIMPPVGTQLIRFMRKILEKNIAENIKVIINMLLLKCFF